MSPFTTCVIPFRFSDPSTDKTTKEHPPEVFIQRAFQGTDTPSVLRSANFSADFNLNNLHIHATRLRYNYSWVSHTDFCMNIWADFFSTAQRCNLISLWCNAYSCKWTGRMESEDKDVLINKFWYLQQLQIARFITGYVGSYMFVTKYSDFEN